MPSEIPSKDDAGRRSALLELPRELRDLIFQQLLDIKEHLPENPDHAGSRDPNWQTPCTIYFEAHSPRPALLQLKLCNRQIHDEVCQILEKHADHETDPAHLDVMIKGSSIWPTWISLPPTRHFSSTVHITLRLFEAKGLGSEFSTGAYRGLWTLFNLLVSRGPCLIHNSTGLRPPLSIGRLRFDIMLCYPTSVDDLFGTYRDVFERIAKLASDNVGLGNVGEIEASMGPDRRLWRLKQLPTGLTFASRV